MKKDFKKLLLAAQANDHEGFDELLLKYKPLLMKESVIDGIFDEYLYQKYCMTFFRCVQKFSAQRDNTKD